MDDKGATFVDRLEFVEPGPERTRALPIYLIVLSGGMPGAMLRVGHGVNSIGRSDQNALLLPEPSISRRHASIRVDRQGKATILDLNSSNGTFLNGRRLEPSTRVPLYDGDRLRFGSQVMVKFARPDPCEEQFQREMFERSVRDPLTGLYHRAFFLDQVAAIARRAESKGLGVAILMVDIDHFKQVNDSFGHDAGDSVLREVAATIRHCTRAEDLVARFGGEEFVAALPISDPDQAQARAERIRRRLAQRILKVGDVAFRVTASMGIAFAPAGRVRPVSALITSADRGLYQAKHNGRDRICRISDTDALVPSQTTLDE